MDNDSGRLYGSLRGRSDSDKGRRRAQLSRSVRAARDTDLSQLVVLLIRDDIHVTPGGSFVLDLKEYPRIINAEMIRYIIDR